MRKIQCPLPGDPTPLVAEFGSQRLVIMTEGHKGQSISERPVPSHHLWPAWSPRCTKSPVASCNGLGVWDSLDRRMQRGGG